MKRILKIVGGVVWTWPSLCVIAEAENVPELALTSDTTLTVESGDVKRIEYISGTAAARLTKEGGGTLEVAIVGNTNASFFVNGGELKFVRPGRLTLDVGDAAFHVDGSDADARETMIENGTNFVTKIKDAEGRSTYATKYSARPNPYLAAAALNGLAVLDFGTMQGSGLTGYGAAMQWSEMHLPNEIFYVWSDYEGLKDLVTTANSIGPTPVNMQFAGYRGKGGAGEGFKLFNTLPDRMATNLKVDDQKATSTTTLGEGWHLLRTYTSTKWADSSLNDYAARGFGYRPNGPSPYGGFRLAEMVICTNYLTAAKREYVNFYLRRKWFGGYPVKKVVLAEGATLDATAAPVAIAHFETTGNTTVRGMENLRLSVASGISTNVLVLSGVYDAPDAAVSAIPNLGFAADGEIAVSSGTNAANVVEGIGTLRKRGAGSFSLGYLGEDFDSLDVAAGSLTISPLLTPAAALHVDAADDAAFTLSEENGTNFVSRWDDVSRNGQAAVQTSESYAYGGKATINRPFRVPNLQNGLPMVDFGSMADAEHQDGWGAMLDVVKPLAAKSQPRITSDEFGVLQLFSVWEDDPAVFDRVSVDDGTGLLKPAVGPSLYGNGYSWYRGAGGNGEGYPFCAMQGPASVREEMWLDNVRFYSQYVRFTVIERGVHLMDQRIGNGDGGSPIGRIGGNQDCQTTNGPYAAKGVYGGVRIGETMAFRYALPKKQREQIRAALGVKWFGTDTYALRYGFRNVSVTNGATLAMPYADVTVTNLMLAGTISSRSLAVRDLDLIGDAVVSAPLTVESGGRISFSWNGVDGFACADAFSFAIEAGGTLELNGMGALPPCGSSYKVVGTETVLGSADGWIWRSSDRSMRACLEKKADGLYLTFGSGGVRIILR